MIESSGPNDIVDAGVEGAVPARQVPSDNRVLANNDDGTPSNPQTVYLHTHVGVPLRFTGLEVNDCDRVFPPPCECCKILVEGKTQGEVTAKVTATTTTPGRDAGEGEDLISCVPSMNF